MRILLCVALPRIISKEKVSALTIKSMTDSIAHRGPDADGHWVDENIGLGHRRLSIIDLSEAAQQPMISMNNRYIISYNGGYITSKN